MTTQAIAGSKVRLLRGDGADPEVFTDFGEVNSVEGPTASAEEIDVTHFASGGYREYITGFLNAGTLSLTCNWTYDAYDIGYNDMIASDPHNYELTYDLGLTTPAIVAFSALTTEVTASHPTDDKVTASITLRITGPLTITPAA